MRVVRGHRQRADAQAGVGRQFHPRADLHRPVDGRADFLLQQPAQSRIGLHHQNVIRGLGQQALAHSFAQRLQRMALLARHTNQRVDELVQAARRAG